MRQFLLFALGLGLLIPTYSQNYQTVNSSEVKLFNTVNLDNIRGYRVDSVVVIGTDSLLYPSRTIQFRTDDYCFDPMGPSMLGGSYYNCGDAFPFLANKYLTYFFKDSVEWGSPYDFTLSLEDKSKAYFFEIYPNPAKDKINLWLNKAPLPLTAEIMDLAGRSIISSTIKEERSTIDISELSKGVYFVFISFSGNGAVQKLIIE